MLRLPLSLISPPGVRGRLTILIFHRVLPEPDPLFPETPTAAEFEARMLWTRRWFNVLPLGQAIDALYAGTIPSRAMAITFDDGYADNEEIAAPILRRLGVTATFFVSTGFLDGACMWNDQVIEAIRSCSSRQIDLQPIGLGCHDLTSPGRRSQAISSILPAIKHHDPLRRQAATDAIVLAAGSGASPRLMMTADQVRNLRVLGMNVGAHTMTHPILSRLGADASFSEMRGSKNRLEQILQEEVKLFAYPNGVPDQDYGIEHAQMASECGFSAAVSTAWGAASVRSDRFQLPRFSPWDRTPLRYGVRLLQNLGRAEKVAIQS